MELMGNNESIAWETVDSVSSTQIIVESFKSVFVHKMSVLFFFFPPQGYFENKPLEAAIHSWLFWEPVKKENKNTYSKRQAMRMTRKGGEVQSVLWASGKLV